MPGKQTLEQHEALMSQMARTVGADLDEAELRGSLPPEVRDEMLYTCSGCSEPGACKKWLSETESASDTPAYCRNTDILLALAAE